MSVFSAEKEGRVERGCKGWRSSAFRRVVRAWFGVFNRSKSSQLMVLYPVGSYWRASYVFSHAFLSQLWREDGEALADGKRDQGGGTASWPWLEPQRGEGSSLPPSTFVFEKKHGARFRWGVMGLLLWSPSFLVSPSLLWVTLRSGFCPLHSC